MKTKKPREAVQKKCTRKKSVLSVSCPPHPGALTVKCDAVFPLAPGKGH